MRKSAALPIRLRALLIRHNCTVAGFAFLSLVAAVVLWGLAYFGILILTMVGMTVARGTSATMPPFFTLDFTVVALALLALAWFDNALTVNDRPPDKRPTFEIFMDFLLAIPRTTLAIWGNLTAWQWLGRPDLRLAAELVVRVAREKRVLLMSVPADIPDQRTRERIIFTLLMIRVLDVRHEGGDAWLRLSPLRPTALEFPDRAQLGP
jgi:hypothetical protein